MMHRLIFLDCQSITDEQGNHIGKELERMDQGRTLLMDVIIRDVKQEKSLNADIKCSHVVMTLWYVLKEQGESNLFSSWKTRVNCVLENVINQKAVGFMDITKGGVNAYY